MTVPASISVGTLMLQQSLYTGNVKFYRVTKINPKSIWVVPAVVSNRVAQHTGKETHVNVTVNVGGPVVNQKPTLARCNPDKKCSSLPGPNFYGGFWRQAPPGPDLTFSFRTRHYIHGYTD